MLLNKIKISALVIGVFFFSVSNLFAQSDKSCCEGKEGHCKTEAGAFAMADSTHMHKKHHEDMKSSEEETSSIVREGEIDLAEIDANEDGMVFQDQMCWNVISDEAGECPQCGMTLKEVSLEKAKENLVKHDYKVK